MLAAPGRRATPEEDDMSWVAIIVAGVVSMGLGALWFSPLMFAKPWTAMRVDKAPMSGVVSRDALRHHRDRHPGQRDHPRLAHRSCRRARSCRRGGHRPLRGPRLRRAGAPLGQPVQRAPG